MMADSVELRYSLSGKDRARMFRFLEKRSLSGESAETRFFSNRYVALASPYVGLAACVFVSITVFQWLAQLLPVIATHGFTQMLSPGFLVGNVVVILLSYAMIRYVWESIVEYQWRNKVVRSSGDGVNSGEHHLSATPEGLTIRLAKRSTIYNWAAFLDLIETKNMLLLMITQRHAVTIPKDAFKSKTEEQSFRDYIRDRMATS